ncbi:ABC transporter [Alteromonadales bacterium alter-6D02]|nr:ABC transporter [Alteromonadales bacterium alter-6D02]
MASGEPVTKGKPLNFPADHGVHAEQGIEWWYLTANLTSDSGETFGVQWTMFRTLMPSKVESQWWDNNLYFAHFAVQHQQQHVAFERFSRAGQAQVISSPFKASIDNWQLSSLEDSFLPLKLTASQDDYAVDLSLSDSPMTLHGDNGYSQKTQSGHASYYYSYPFLAVQGTLTFGGQSYQVSGNAWYDREWSASLLDRDQLGWDWFSLVDSQSANKGLMLFCIRGQAQRYDYCSGTRINAAGQATAISTEQITLTVLDTVTLNNRDYPSQWQVKLNDSQPIIIESVTKDSRNQLTIPYWEGRVKATGGFNGKGYAELTGY